MDDKMESDHSYTGDSSSSTDTSSGSSDGDDEEMEPVRILGHSLELPQELCEDYSLFKEFFSKRTWESLDDKHKEQLSKFLPAFTENEKEETKKTIEMLFHHEPFHFKSPFSTFYNNLKQGNYRPDIAKMRKFLRKARSKQQRHRIKSYYAKLLPEVLLSRERLLVAAKAAPPGPTPRIPSLPPKSSTKNNFKPVYLRAKQRYFEELAAIRGEVGGDESEDENYPDGPPEQYVKKKKGNNVQNIDGSISGTLPNSEQTLPTSLECLKNVLAAHRSRRQYRENHPELNVNGITLDDIKQRVALVNGAKKLMFGGPKIASPIQKIKKASKKDTAAKKIQENKIAKKIKEEIETADIKPLLQNVKIKIEKEASDSENSYMENAMSPKQIKKHMEQVEIKQEITEINYDDQFDALIKQEPPDSMPVSNSGKIDQPIPIKLEDLDGIDMMALPIELADDTGEVIKVKPKDGRDVMVDVDESLTETTHANFLSLVRALFPARAAHRASKQQLHARCSAVMRSPIAPLNTWYNSCDDWCAELDSALDFLAGERGPHPDDFVPYLQYMPENQMYQWIGAGRDCDAILGRLCERWLRAADEPAFIAEAPPPRYPTSWVMRTPTSFEIAEFRAQERRRFSSAGKPFTYIQHGYRSVVGPCARSWWTGATGAGLLRGERPRHAAFPALVRDALARLPNGEGTRHHLLILLKMSQWIAPCNDQSLLTAVSATLDKLCSIKRDPVVKYDQRTATWTYLHRNRTEEDWLKISNRGKKFGATSIPSLPASTTPPAVKLQTPAKDKPHSPQRGAEMDSSNLEDVYDGSDSDVDVDDTSTPVPHLSSAQLLMQATQQKPAAPPPAKPKPKVPTPPAKPKPPPKTPSNKQTNKQAALMTQSVKQASLMAATMKQVMPQAKVSQAKATPKVTLSPQTPKVDKPKIVVNSIQKPNTTVKTVCVTKPEPKPSPKQTKVTQVKPVVTTTVTVPTTSLSQTTTQISKSLPSLIVTPQKSPLIKQRPLQRTDTSPAIVTMASQKTPQTTVTLIHPTSETTVTQNANKVVQGTRSLLIKPTTVQTTVTATTTIPITQVTPIQRRGIVRVLSPATPSSGKSLISPRALMQAGTTAAKKRTFIATTAITTIAQSTESKTTVASSTPSVVTSSVPTRTIQLAGGRTVQLAANQTVHLPGGQAVQLSSGHTLQLSSLQLPMHSVRLPSGQTVQLASPQTMQAVRVSNATVKTSAARSQQTTSVVKNLQTSQGTVQIPVSTVQLAGQTVQIAGQTVQLAGQSVQLTGHTVKLPSGQSVQVASQSVLPSQSVQLPSGQTVQLTSGNVQTVQLSNSNVQNSQIASGQSVQLGSQTVQLGGQTVQLPSGQTVQLPGGQTVQLPSGQTLQLSTGQTVQLSSGQTLQLASGQTVHLANQGTKGVTQVIRGQTIGDKTATAQPIVAKLLTNAQGQMLSVEGAGGLAARGVRVLAPTTRLARPLLLTAAKPLHNIILQQSDGTPIRVTSSGVSPSSQTLVLSNLGAQTVTTSTTTTPVLKLQQVNPLQQVKLAPGIKIQQAGTNATVATSSGVRSVVMDGQQLKLVGGRHVLARILRPAHQPP